MHIILVILWNLIILMSIALENSHFLDVNEIKKNIEYITIHNNIADPEKEKIIDKLKSALYSISKKKDSEIKIKEYQNIIDNFSSIIYKLHNEKHDTPAPQNNIILSSNELRQYQLQINQQLIQIDQKLEQEQDLYRTINESLMLLPHQQYEVKKELNNINQKISHLNTIKKKISYIEQAELIALQAEKEEKKIKISELELQQLSANNRQEISRLHIELLKKQYDQLDKKLQILHTQLYNIRQQETEQTIKNIESLIKNKNKHITLPESIIQQIQINRQLSESLNKQIHNINSITLQQKEITARTLKIKQMLSKLLEQSKWINKSTALGETLRAQMLKLPKQNIYKSQQLDNKMTKLREERLQYEEQIDKISLLSYQNKKNHYNTTKILTNNQKKTLNTQINIQKKLLNSLLENCDIQILELTKLKIAHEELNNSIKETENTIQQHLFWIADLHPINSSYPYRLYQDLHVLINKINLSQLQLAIKITITQNITISLLFITFLLFILCTNKIYHRHYNSFLTQSKKRLQKTNEEYFSLTVQNIFWSNIISLPIPILWITIGYLLIKMWEYPILISIGEGIILSTPILWILIIIMYFTSKNGLFIVCFKWEIEKNNIAFRHYILHIITIILFLTITITFNNYHDKEFYHTLSRFFFIILCISLTFMMNNIKQVNLPLYIDQYGSYKNIINHILWYIVSTTPIVSAIISCIGYLTIAQKLLLHSEISLIILLTSSIIYYTIQCWILTHKHHILYTYNINKKQTSMVENIKTTKSQILIKNTNIINNTNKKKTNNLTINIENISNQLLQFTRSTLIFITLSIIFLLWSEFHFIFTFLERITIWDIRSSNIQGVNNIQPITLKTLLTSILIFFITSKITKNLPPLLELTIFQYVNLTPGSNYAITTTSKYIIMFLGIIIGCSHIGIEWSKLQWLVAAIGVGLGFGLQEIFANFISGLIILFEKPIRIGDTITISNLTGKITQINTRATTIKDRDHKEIIIPNKEFITTKFINWSLSDTITRVVLKVPAPPKSDITQIIQILLEAVKCCPLVLKSPKPEIFLTNIENGIPLFEIRIYTSKMSHRTPLRHQMHILIIFFYKKYGLNIPFPHINIKS